MTDEITTVCALLHDVVEDTEITFDALFEMGFPKIVLDVLTLLTHEEDMPYMEYVKKVATNPIAKKVKIADLMHNSDVTRLDQIDEYVIKRNEKYAEALRLLTKDVP